MAKLSPGLSDLRNPERDARYRWAAELVIGGRVLDAGCGTGWGTALLATGASAATGVDFSPASIADARREHAATNVDFIEGDIRHLPFDRAEFDYVVSFEALVHVAEPEVVLDELRRVLRPAGTLLVSIPNRAIYPPGNPLHLSELSSNELEDLLGRRFANVAMYRQQSYHASLLGPDELLAEEDPARSLAAAVSKLGADGAGSELHAVAAASDGELPVAPSRVVLGDLVDYGEQQALLEEWQERAVKAEATALAQARKLRELQR